MNRLTPASSPEPTASGVSGQLKLSDRLSGRNNNLNLIRVVAASAVLVSHAFPISIGRGAEEPLEKIAGISLGGLAVAVFFAISGLLITKSFDRRPNMARFLTARFLRLVPALLVVLSLTVVAGIWLTELSVQSYLLNLATLTYIPRNLSLVFMQFTLPGVFALNPYPAAINGSLWTLFYEVLCYGGVVVLGLAGLFRHRMLFLAFTGVVAVFFIIALDWSPTHPALRRVDLLIQVGYPFVLGMAAYLWRDRLSLNWKIGGLLWLLCIPMLYSAYAPFFVVSALAYSVSVFAFVPRGVLMRYNSIGDFSYGIYIYAFPIQQLIAMNNPDFGPYENMAWSFPLVLIIAIASWKFIEEPALRYTDWLADRFQIMKARVGA